MSKPFRISGLVIASLMTILGIGFFLEQPWVLSMWPWPIKGLSYAFVSSIFAAIAAPIFWISITNEPAAICGGAINLFVTFTGLAVYSFNNTHMPGVQMFGVVCAVLALGCLAQVLMTHPIPFKDNRRMPMLVRYSFILFATILTYVGGTLVLHRANMFPWPLKPEHQVIYGWIFLGSACYFVDGFVKPVWGNLRGQLWGFLAYDLVLIVPYVKHFGSVPDDLRNNLIIYVTVLVYSGLLAIYALFASRPISAPA